MFEKLTARAGRVLSHVARVLHLRAFPAYATASTAPRSRGAITGQLAMIKRSEWLYISLSRISDAIAFAGWRIVDTRTKKPITDETAPVVQIFVRPNISQDWPQFVDQLVYHWRGAGNAFVLLDAKSGLGNPTALWLLQPDRVRIIPDKRSFIAGYEYLAPSGETVKLKPEDVVHLKFTDPTDPYWGMGPVAANDRLFDMDNSAAEYARAFFRNGGEPGVVLSTEGSIDPEARQALKESWAEEYSGAGRAHRLAILEGGLKMTPRGTSPKEADMIETRKFNRDSVFGMLGVPPIIGGVVENANRSNSTIQNRIWVRLAILPLLRRLEPNLSRIAGTFGPYAFLFTDPVVEDSELDATIGSTYLQNGAITPNEYRTIYAGLPKVLGNPAMDEHYISPLLVPLSDSLEPLAPVTKPGAPGAPVAPAAGDKVPAVNPVAEVTPAGHAHAPKGTLLQRRMLRHYVRQRLRLERTFRRRIASFFREQGEAVIARVLGRQAADVRALGDAFDMAADEQAWQRITTAMFGEMGDEYKLTARLLGYDPAQAFKPGNPDFDRRFQRLARKVVQVSETTRDELESVITTGVQLGLSPSQIANGEPDQDYPGIRGLFEEFAQNRAQLIARTESAKLLDQANTAVYRGLGVQTVDVIGCEDEVIVEGQRYGCNSQGIPIADAETVEFHPNHKGAIVPRLPTRQAVAQCLTAMNKVCYESQDMSEQLQPAGIA